MRLLLRPVVLAAFGEATVGKQMWGATGWPGLLSSAAALLGISSTAYPTHKITKLLYCQIEGAENNSWLLVFFCDEAMASATSIYINQTMSFPRIYCDNSWALGIISNRLLASSPARD